MTSYRVVAIKKGFFLSKMSLGRQKSKLRRRLSRIFQKSKTVYIPEDQLPLEEEQSDTGNSKSEPFNHFDTNNIDSFEEIKMLH